MTNQTAKEENTVTTQTEKPDNAKANEPKGQTAKEIIRVKQELKWHFMSLILELIHGHAISLGTDFYKLLDPLEKFVYDRLYIPDGYEITDEYIICECVKA